jgi:hypothetical protein
MITHQIARPAAFDSGATTLCGGQVRPSISFGVDPKYTTCPDCIAARPDLPEQECADRSAAREVQG